MNAQNVIFGVAVLVMRIIFIASFVITCVALLKYSRKDPEFWAVLLGAILTYGIGFWLAFFYNLF